MNGNNYLTLLSPVVGAIFTVFLISLWVHNSKKTYILILASAFACYTIATGSRLFFIPSNASSLTLISSVFFIACIGLGIEGCLRRKSKTLNYGLIALIVTATLIINIYCYYFVENNLATRVYVISFANGTMAAIASYQLRPSREDPFVDKVIFLLFLLLSIQLFVRPLLLVDPADLYIGRKSFADSPFWLAMHFSLIVSAVLIGLTILFAIMTDITADLKKESATDVLTGVYNRRGFDERAAAVIESGKHHPVSLVVCDIDQFKSINDRHGHPAGDRVIEKLSSLLTAHVRNNDVVARIGGEEFAILLTECTPAGARSFAERVRILFEVPGIDALPGLSKTTASFGIASHRQGESLQQLMNRADRLLYEAKKTGRNRVCSDEDNLEFLVSA